jgi:hypothetical protein
MTGTHLRTLILLAAILGGAHANEAQEGAREDQEQAGMRDRFLVGLSLPSEWYGVDVGAGLADSSEGNPAGVIDAHAFWIVFNGSVEYSEDLLPKHHAELEHFRGYAGIGLLSLAQLEYGTGKGGGSIRLRSDIVFSRGFPYFPDPPQPNWILSPMVERGHHQTRIIFLAGMAY